MAQPTFLSQAHDARTNIDLITSGIFITKGYQEIVVEIGKRNFDQRSNYALAGIVMSVMLAILLPVGFATAAGVCIIIPITYLWNLSSEKADLINTMNYEFNALAQIYTNAANYFVAQRKIREEELKKVYSAFKEEYWEKYVKENEANHKDIIALANRILSLQCPIPMPTRNVRVLGGSMNLTPFVEFQGVCRQYIKPDPYSTTYLRPSGGNYNRTWVSHID